MFLKIDLEEIRTIIKRCTDAANPIQETVRPIVFDHKEYSDNVYSSIGFHGSSVLCLYQEKLFILMAKHSIYNSNGTKKEDLDKIRFLRNTKYEDDVFYENENFFIPKPESEDISFLDPTIDFLLVSLDDSHSQDIKKCNEFAVTSFSCSLPQDFRYYIAIGFPTIEGHAPDYDNKKMIFSRRLILCEYMKQSEPGLDQYRIIHDITPSYEPLSPIESLSGMSGGGIWGVTENGEALFMGMIVQGTLESKSLIVLNAPTLRSYLEKSFL